jgi:GNAT superfamily N-acetyltransferase
VPPGAALLRPVHAADWPLLPEVFAAAFDGVQPFGSLEDDWRLAAARASLHQTHSGGDGPWIEAASVIAEADGAPIGGALVTLVPPAPPPGGRENFIWLAPPPPNAVAGRLGRPHLTWIFVRPDRAGRHLGSALLDAVRERLLGLGFVELVSTFLLGNDSSMMWHWRRGFRLLP